MQDIHKTGYCYNNLKLDNVMVNDREVSLVGFGNATKIGQNPFMGVRRSRSEASELDFSILTDKSWIASPYKDLASVYLIMITLLLNENYSAFESFVSTSDPNCDT